MAAQSLNELFMEELQDMYDAEKQLTRALPKLARAAQTPELQEAFTTHLEETRGHVTRLEQVFEGLGQKAKGKKCEGIEGIIEEGSKAIEELNGAVRDAALIAGAQKAEHYEIASYGTLARFAELLGLSDAHDLLGQNLQEEKAADEKLTEIADSSVNHEAESDDEEPVGGSVRSSANKGRSTTGSRR